MLEICLFFALNPHIWNSNETFVGLTRPKPQQMSEITPFRSQN